ncbi:MAG: PAS domain S-box protein [Verrucomicrobia bacterium]|nr:PAS domain S-box protein [Verrucomicrobiota bacterium]
MTRPLSLLMIEDSESDADLVVRRLQKAGYEVRAERVEDADGMKAALVRQSWDVIICDYSLPQFDAPSALAQLQRAKLDIPFLIVSGAIGEDTAVTMMKAGAHDYLMKSNLARLVPAVEREIREAQVRRERRVAEGVIARLAAIVESSDDAIVGKTLDGIVVNWNSGAEKLYGYIAAEIVGCPISILIPADRPGELPAILEKIKLGDVVSHLETKRRRKDGKIIDVSLTISPIRDAAGLIVGAASIARDITERKRAEHAVLQAKEDWERTFDAVPDLVAILDNEYRIIRANRSMAARLGLPLNKCVGQTCHSAVHGTDDPPEFCPHKQLLADGIEHTAEIHENRLNGDFLETVSPLRDSEGKLIGSVHIARDITERKQREQALRHSVSLMQATLESTADGILVVDLQGRIVDFNERFIRMWRFPKEMIPEWKNRDLMTASRDQQAVQLMLGQLKDPEGFVAKVQKLYAHPEVTGFDVLEFKDGRVFERYSLPQCIEGRPVGRVWSFRDVTGRKLAEEALRTSEERYRLLFNSSYDAVIVSEGPGANGLPGKIIEVNDVACQRLGYSREELTQKNLSDIDAPEFLPLLPEIMEKLKEKKHALWEAVHVAKDGRRIAVEISADLFQLNGKPTILSDCRDISERRQAEEKLRESEERFRQIFEEGPSGMAIVGADFRYIQANTAFCKMLGYTEEELASLTSKDITHPEHLKQDVESVENLLRGDIPVYRTEKRYIRKDGEIVWCSVVATVIRDKQGRAMYYLVMAQDITERKRVEEGLAREQSLLNSLITTIPDNIYFKDLNSRFVRINEAMSRSFGLRNASDVVGKTDSDFFAAEHAREALEDEKRVMGRGESMISKEEKEIWPDGRVTWVSTTKVPLRDKSGKITGLVGVSRDITAHKQTEEEIRASLEEKTVLLKEVHHRVKNNLQIVISLMNLQAVRTKNTAALDTLQETGNRVRSMALLHETLYRSQNLAHVNFANYIENICSHLFRSYGPKAAQIKLRPRLEEVAIDLDRAVSCGLIINELVSNALKHAFPGGQGGHIEVELRTTPQEQIVLRVADDGVGLPSGLDIHQTGTLGHQLVFMLVEKLHGAVEITRDRGVAFHITFQAKQGE